MILKIKDHANNWSWIANIEHLEQLGSIPPEEVDLEEYAVNEIEYCGSPGASTTHPHMMFVISGGPRILAVNCKQAFLIHEQTGSTIDVVINETQGS